MDNLFCHNVNAINVLKIISVIIKYLKVFLPIFFIALFSYKYYKNIKNNKFILSNLIFYIIKIGICIITIFLPSLLFLFLSNFSNLDKTKNKVFDCLKCVNNYKYCEELDELYVKQKKQNIEDDTYIYEQILPPNNANIIEEKTTPTFKYSIEKVNDKYGLYYVSRIWVKNAYLQLHKFNSPDFGKKLYYPSYILEKAITEKNLDDKLVLGFNANAFYENMNHQQATILFYKPYDKTSVGTLVITEGEVTRNFYDHWYKTWTIMGINENNKMILFQDDDGGSSENKEIKNQQIIDSGIRNTFTFAGPLVVNGEKSDIISSMPDIDDKFKRQAICQIDDNNFVLITSDFDNRTFTRDELIEVLLSLNCETATNLDGGGSVVLITKDKNNTKMNIITGNKRTMADVAYFTELGDNEL